MTQDNIKLRQELVDNACMRMDENMDKVQKCLGQLTEEQLWQRPNESSNSMGNLVLHLIGNITQYAISSLGGAEDKRKRDLEFTDTPGYSKDELLARLAKTVAEAKSCFASASGEELIKMRKVQSYNLSGLGVLLHVVEHFSYHTGQIAFYTKLLNNKDLGFYKGINLNN